MSSQEIDDSLTFLEERFSECLALGEAQRRRYLEELERSRPGQAKVVAELVAISLDSRLATGDAARALNDSEWVDHETSSAVPEEAKGFVAGSRVGPFVVQEKIGEGGMATVYRAHRDTEDFHQEVAIKVLKQVVDSAEGVARFERERRIVAGLDHPNIAGLIDGGLTQDGRPYVALELVHGEPIHHYCDRHRLSVKERARLVGDVARALQTAHQNLIVHRDLKPSNVLVDDRGCVRLLDFGIAKELEQDPLKPITRLGSRPMTPIYASPEQLEGEAVTTASDQYQLGLLFFELVTGQCHHALDGADAMKVQRRSRELPTPRPSQFLASHDSFSTADGQIDRQQVARSRAATVDQLINALRNDLDWIILKSLEKRPEDRYSSLAALAEDLERFLAGRPILARPPSRTYLLRKWVARHRSQTALAVLALIAVLAGSSIATWQAVRATHSERQAMAEADTAKQVSELLMDLFEVSDPENARGDELSARQLLERGGQRIETELQDRPLIQGRMMAKIALIHRKLGMYQEALPLAERASEQLRAELGQDHPEVSESRRELARAYADSGDDGRAEPVLQHLVETLEAGDDELELARARVDLAAIHYRRADLDRSQALYLQALAVLESHPGTDEPELARGLAGLATVHHARGELQEAESARRRVLEIYERRFGDGHPDLAQALSQLADTLGWQGRDQEAAPLHERAVGVLEKVYGPEHRAVASGLNRLGSLYGRMGKLDAARTAFERSTAIKEKVFGPGHAETITGHLNLGRVHVLSGEMALGRQRFQLALETATGHLGGNHPLRGFALSELARLHRDVGELTTAQATYERALEILEQAFGPEHPRLAETLDGLAFIATEHGRFDAAEALFRRALAIQEKAYGAGKPPLGGPLNGLGVVLRRQGRLAEAKEAHQQAHDAWTNAYGESHPAAGVSLCRLADVLVAEGDLEGAQQSYHQALDIAVQAHGDDHLETVAPLEGLADVAQRTGKTSEAYDFLQRATRIRATTYGDKHATVVANRAELQQLIQVNAAP